jgi:hypothetical protein
MLWSAPQTHSVDPSGQPASTVVPVAEPGQANRADMRKAKQYYSSFSKERTLYTDIR